MSQQVVLNVLEILKSRPEMLVAPSSIDFSNPIVGVTRPTDAQDPFIVYAALDYKPDAFEEGVKGWKEVVAQTEKTEPQTLAYICLKDRDQENRIRMFEVYENEKVFETHCRTESVGKKIKDEERLKAKDPNVVFLKRVSGFLSKL
jgi:quinol monooxygenase YgiN